MKLAYSFNDLSLGREGVSHLEVTDEYPKHGEVLDEVLQDEIKDLTPEQIRQVLEYIGQLKEQ